MKNLVFLLEEPSAKDLLQGLLPKLVPNGISIYYLIFEGKQDLEGQLVKKLRGWQLPDSAFIVLRDQDAAECLAVKKKLADLVAESSRRPALVRVACRELEAWIVGDWQAVAQAFNRPLLAAQSTKEAYRDPDKLVRPVEALRRFIPEYQKREGARRIGVLLNPARNLSGSFRTFCLGVQRLVSEAT